MAEISTAPVQGLADGGYLVGVTDEATPAWSRLPMADVETGVTLATTALQPTDVGSAATLDADDIATTAELAAALAAQTAINASLQAQIDALMSLVGAGVDVLETDIVDEEVID